ncbi:hypothetical protein COOONC_02781 [Cooperia oncophora]
MQQVEQTPFRNVSEDMAREGEYKMATLLPKAEGQKAILGERENETVYYPAAGQDETRFCVVCGKHERFRLDKHLSKEHNISKEDALYEVCGQVGRGILNRMTSASVDLSTIPTPLQPGEWLIYSAFVLRLRECGIPLLNERHFERAEQPAIQREAIERAVEPPGLPAIAIQAEVVQEDVRSMDQSRNADLQQGEQSPYIEAGYAYKSTLQKTMNIEVKLTNTPQKVQQWMNDVDRQLKLWRKLIQDQHPILRSYANNLKRTTVRDSEQSVPVRVHDAVQVYDETRHTRKCYASNVERFMLVAMRSRKR